MKETNVSFALDVGSDLLPHVVWQDILDIVTDNERDQREQSGGAQLLLFAPAGFALDICTEGPHLVGVKPNKDGKEKGTLSATALRVGYGLHNAALIKFQQNMVSLEQQDMTLSFGSKWSHLFHQPFEDGNAVVCQWLVCTGLVPNEWRTNAFLTAAMKGHLSLCQWLADNMEAPASDMHSPHVVVHTAIQRGHTQMVRWLVERFQWTKAHVWMHYLAIDCVESRDVPFCEWAKDWFGLTLDHVSTNCCQALRTAASLGLLDMCQWLVTAFNLDEWDAHYSVQEAAEHGQTQVCQWMIERFDYSGMWLLKHVVEWGEEAQVATCQWIVDYFEMPPKLPMRDMHDLCREVYRKKNSDVCQWLVDRFKLTPNDVIPDFECTKWVLSHANP